MGRRQWVAFWLVVLMLGVAFLGGSYVGDWWRRGAIVAAVLLAVAVLPKHEKQP